VAEWVETFKGAVLAAEYDREAFMNSQIYVSRFDQATWFLLGTIGLTPKTCKKRKRRIAVVRQNFQYLRELQGGELVVVKSGFVAVGKKHFRFVHQMYDQEGGRMVATSDVTAVEASLASGRTQELPASYRKAAEGLLVTSNVDADKVEARTSGPASRKASPKKKKTAKKK
jgi:acyl-CoA thioesterase FadM